MYQGLATESCDGIRQQSDVIESCNGDFEQKGVQRVEIGPLERV